MFSGRLREAVEAARRVVELAPQYGFGHLVLTEALVKLGDIDGAAPAAREAFRLLPGHFHALLWSGIAFSLTGDLEGAAANELKAIAMQPMAADPRNVLAEVYYKQGRREEAMAVLEACVSEASPNAQTFSLIGNFRLRIEDIAGALQAFERGLEIEPRRADLQSQAKDARERLLISA